MRKSRLFSYISLPAVCCSVFSPTLLTFAEKFQDENKVVEALISKMASGKWMPYKSLEENFLISLIAKNLETEEDFGSFLENLKEVINCRTMILNYIKSIYEELFSKDSKTTTSSLTVLYQMLNFSINKVEDISGQKGQKLFYKNFTSLFDINRQKRGKEVNAFFTGQLLKTLELIERNSKENPNAISSYLQSEENILSFLNRTTQLNPESLFIIYTFYKDFRSSKKASYKGKKPVVKELDQKDFFKYLTKEEQNKVALNESKICAYLVKLHEKEYLLYSLLNNNHFVIKSVTNNKAYNIDEYFFDFLERLLKSSKLKKEKKETLEGQDSDDLYEKFSEPFYKNTLTDQKSFLLGKINSFSINFFNSQNKPKQTSKIRGLRNKSRKKEENFKISTESKNEMFPINKEEQNKNKLLNNIDLKVVTGEQKEKDTFFLKKKRKFFNVNRAENNGLNKLQKKCNLFNVKKNDRECTKFNCLNLKVKSKEEESRVSAFKENNVFTLGNFENKVRIGSMFSNKSSSILSDYSLSTFKNIFNKNSGDFNFLLCNMLEDEPKSSGNLFG